MSLIYLKRPKSSEENVHYEQSRSRVSSLKSPPPAVKPYFAIRTRSTLSSVPPYVATNLQLRQNSNPLVRDMFFPRKKRWRTTFRHLNAIQISPFTASAYKASSPYSDESNDVNGLSISASMSSVMCMSSSAMAPKLFRSMSMPKAAMPLTSVDPS